MKLSALAAANSARPEVNSAVAAAMPASGKTTAAHAKLISAHAEASAANEKASAAHAEVISAPEKIRLADAEAGPAHAEVSWPNVEFPAAHAQASLADAEAFAAGAEVISASRESFSTGAELVPCSNNAKSALRRGHPGGAKAPPRRKNARFPASAGTIPSRTEAGVRVAATPRRNGCRRRLVARAAGPAKRCAGSSRGVGVAATCCDEASQLPYTWRQRHRSGTEASCSGPRFSRLGRSLTRPRNAGWLPALNLAGRLDEGQKCRLQIGAPAGCEALPGSILRPAQGRKRVAFRAGKSRSGSIRVCANSAYLFSKKVEQAASSSAFFGR